MYRIKIDELRNGQIQYMPQKLEVLNSSRTTSNYQTDIWLNLALHPLTDKETAIICINEYKQKEIDKKDREIISSTYESID